MLHVQVPLLHVGPDYLGRDRQETARKLRCGPGETDISDVSVSDDVVLRCGNQQRGRLTFHAFGVRLIAVSMLEEHAVSATNCSFPSTENIPCKTDTGSGIEEMSFHATDWNAANA